MKKILTILTVALLACTTVFAALNVSGEFEAEFEAGYKFSFKDGKYAAESQDAKEGKFVLKVTDDANIWTINIKALDKLDSSNKLDGNLALDLDALLAANGVDMGDVSLALSIGNNSAMTALSAYNDVTGDAGYKFKNNGNYSTELAVGYGDYIQTKIAFDPRAGKRDSKGNVDPTSKNGSIVVSAMTAPVDGVKVSLAYSRDAIIYAKGSDDNAVYAVNAFGGAVDLNVGALAGLDFDLGVSVYDNYGWGGTSEKNKTTEKLEPKGKAYNALAAAVYGGVDVVDAFVEFRVDSDIDAKAVTNVGMKSQVNFNVVENLGLDVFFNIGNFDEFKSTYEVGGDVSYTLSGVKFAANLKYAGDTGNGVFSITPKVVVTF